MIGRLPFFSRIVGILGVYQTGVSACSDSANHWHFTSLTKTQHGRFYPTIILLPMPIPWERQSCARRFELMKYSPMYEVSDLAKSKGKCEFSRVRRRN